MLLSTNSPNKGSTKPKYAERLDARAHNLDQVILEKTAAVYICRHI